MKARRRHIHLSGSCAESGMVSRFFMEESNDYESYNFFLGGINKATEFDMEFTILDLTPNLKDLIVEISERPGYVRLRDHPGYLANAQSLGWDVYDKHKRQWDRLMRGIFYEDDYIRAHNLKVYFFNLVGGGIAKNHFSKYLQSLIAGALRKPRYDVVIEHALNLTNATAETHTKITIDKEKFFKISYDCVPMIRLQWWPDAANEWKVRQRVWPSEYVIQELTQIGYVIGKPQNKGDRNATDLRYAFSHIEHKLVNMRSKRQKMIYLIFKVIWVKHVKPFNPDKISSFIAKTVMFWVCEEIHPGDAWWSRNYHEILKDLYRRMLDSFENGFLPYYFIPGINVLSQISWELIENEIKPHLRKIIFHIEDYVPKSFDKIIIFGNSVLQTFEPVCKALSDFQNGDYLLLLRQPELIVDELLYIICETDLKILRKIREAIEGTENLENGLLCDESCQKLLARWNDIEKKRFWISRKRIIKKILAATL